MKTELLIQMDGLTASNDQVMNEMPLQAADEGYGAVVLFFVFFFIIFVSSLFLFLKSKTTPASGRFASAPQWVNGRSKRCRAYMERTVVDERPHFSSEVIMYRF